MKFFPIIPILYMVFFVGVFLFIAILRNKSIPQVFILILLFLINLRPMIPSGDSQTISNNVDVLFVIDTTISMNAEDYNGKHKRLDGVKADCRNIIDELAGSRFSLIHFNNDAKISVPFTRDSDMVYEAIDILDPIEQLYARGSSLNTALDIVRQSLDASYEKDADRKRILFFISDGEITDDSKLASFRDLEKYVDGGAVLGYGTTSGGYMKNTNRYSTNDEYITYYSNYKTERAVSKIDEANLKQIASDIGISYIHMDKYDNISSVLSSIKRGISNDMASSGKKNYEDLYFIFVLPLLVLITIEFGKYRRVLK